MSDRPTPETDACIIERRKIHKSDGSVQLVELIDAEFARQLERERDEALNESLEQARLLGISGERECRLIAERDKARTIAKEAITGLYNLGDYDLANRLSSNLEETK